VTLENIPTHGGCAPQSGLVYDMPEADYHTHPALSSTGARRMLRPGCPALFDFERRNPREATQAMKLGRAAHRETLGVGSDIVLGDWPDFRTKAAQEWRDEAEAAGLIPLLRDGKQWQHVRGMRDALHAHPLFGRLFDPERGHAEVSAFWTDDETGVECRARFDFLPDPVDGRRLVIPDYKKTADPEPGAFARDAAKYGYPMQADWYLRGAQALGLGTSPAFVFATQSADPPYLVSVVQLSRQDLILASHRNRIALHTFKACTEADRWPGYGETVHTLDMPAYWRNESESLIDESDLT